MEIVKVRKQIREEAMNIIMKYNPLTKTSELEKDEEKKKDLDRLNHLTILYIAYTKKLQDIIKSNERVIN